HFLNKRQHLLAFEAHEVVADIGDAAERHLVGGQRIGDAIKRGVLENPAARLVAFAGALFAPGCQFLQRRTLVRTKLPGTFEAQVVIIDSAADFRLILATESAAVFLQPLKTSLLFQALSLSRPKWQQIGNVECRIYQLLSRQRTLQPVGSSLA